MSGQLEIKNKAKGERVVKEFKKQQTRRKVDEETGIPGAMELIEKLQKEVAALKKKTAGHEKILQKLWNWKLKQEMGDKE